MATNLITQPANLGLLGKLSPEIRAMIYHYHLVLPEPICMVSCPTSSIYEVSIGKVDRDLSNPRYRSLKYINGSSGEAQLIGCPSRLVLLATSKTVYKEALHIYYRENRFHFCNVLALRAFIASPGSRCRFMRDLSFSYYPMWVPCKHFDELIRDCQDLRVLRIEFKNGREFGFAESPAPLVNFVDLELLRKVRGIKTLELSGKYLMDVGNGELKEVDINHPGAIGPILQRELTTPRG